jgi:hypothetical protein
MSSSWVESYDQTYRKFVGEIIEFYDSSFFNCYSAASAFLIIAHLGVPTWCLEPGLACRNRLLVGLLLGGLYGEASLGHALPKLLGLDLGV